MKKIISCILVIGMVITIVGCQKPVGQETTDTAGQTEPLIESGPISIDAPFTAVGLPTITEEVTAEDGTVLFSKTYPNLSLTLSGQAAADLIIVDFLNKVDAAVASADSIAESAKEKYTGSGSWTPYSYQIAYRPARIDRGVLSLFGITTTYSGGSHPEYACVSASYNLLTGDPLTLGSILTHVDSLEPLCELVISKLEAQAEEKSLRTGFQADIRQRFAGEESYDDDWYFSDTGLCFYFAPYEIAPYSSGVITAQIPYSELVGIIGDEFFPAENQIQNGNAQVVPYSAEAAAKYSHISEMIFDNDGQMYFVEADSCIQNIRLTSTQTAAEQTGTQARETVYKALYLNPGDAIMVQIAEENAGTITIEYEQDGQLVRIPLVSE